MSRWEGGTQFPAWDWEENRFDEVIVANTKQNKKKCHFFYITLANS